MGFAHLENSNIMFNNDKSILYGSSDIGQLYLNLLRFGNDTPNSFIKIRVPNASLKDKKPIICLSGLTVEDVFSNPISSCNEYSIKLEKGGRNVLYHLNINDDSLSSTNIITQASTIIDFGKLTKEKISLPVEATNLNKGSGGNGLIIEIKLNEKLNSSYAKTEVINNRHLVIEVCESPYIV